MKSGDPRVVQRYHACRDIQFPGLPAAAAILASALASLSACSAGPRDRREALDPATLIIPSGSWEVRIHEVRGSTPVYVGRILDDWK